MNQDKKDSNQEDDNKQLNDLNSLIQKTSMNIRNGNREVVNKTRPM